MRKKLTLLFLTFVMSLAFTPSVFAAPAGWKEVSTASRLKAALNDATTTQVILTANIEVPKDGIIINQNKPSLVIDGDGFTLTDYSKTTTSGHTIRLMNSGKLKEITVQNLNVVGYNDSGFIYIKNSSSVKNVTMIYDNVTYTGPQALENRHGHARFINCDINIIPVDGHHGEEVAEAINITLEGDINITKSTPKNRCEVFRVMNDNNNGRGGITVARGAHVVVSSSEDNAKVKSSGFVHFTGNSNYLIFEEDSYFSFDGNNIFAQRNAVNDLQIKENAQVYISTTGDMYANQGLITVDGRMVVEEGSTLRVIAMRNTEKQGVLALKGKADTVTFNSPNEVFIYNSSSQKSNDGLAIEGDGTGAHTINFNNVRSIEYWLKNKSDYLNLPQPTKIWANDDGASYNARIIISKEKIKSASCDNYNGTAPFNANNAAIEDINVIRLQ
ncbi:MAG: hypothetical protein LBL35_09230 [Clostridiales bacterium]|jgi:hypothetical protein|nr:hypothetical protein [Clostridiales bacterium]